MAPEPSTSRIMSAISLLWLALCAIWLAVIFVTDLPAWPLPIWIAVTLGPITVYNRTRHQARLEHKTLEEIYAA